MARLLGARHPLSASPCGCDVGVGFRQLNAALEDIGTWSAVDVSSTRNSALAIAVRPRVLLRRLYRRFL